MREIGPQPAGQTLKGAECFDKLYTTARVEPKEYVMKSAGSLELAVRELRDMSWDPVRMV